MTVEISKNPLSLSYSVYISKYEKEEEENNNNNKSLVSDWIDKHKKTLNDFEYVLMSDINKEKELKQQIIEMLESEHWEYKPCLNRKGLNKRGYKKLI